MRKVALFVLLLALTGTACKGSGNFTPADLSKAVLTNTDAPPGTQRVDEASGPQTLDTFADDAEEKAQLSANGFRGGHQGVYMTAGYEDGKENARLILSFAIALKDPEAAKAQFAWYVQTFLPKQATKGPLTQLPDPKLGDESFAFTFTSFQDSPHPTGLVLWRRANAILASMSSAMTAFDTQSAGFAKLMNDRL